MRSRFDEQMKTLHENMILMGGACEKVIELAAAALRTGDGGLGKEVIRLDEDIDQMEKDVERLCLRILLQQQPVARDLRQISAALKMITDMERIGDQAADIAEILPFLAGRMSEEGKDIQRMAEETSKMVRDSIEAYVQSDLAMAERVLAYDDVVDDYFVKVKKSLIGMIAENPNNGEFALDLLMIAKYFERIGDHATNIAEWVIFSVTGKHEGK